MLEPDPERNPSSRCVNEGPIARKSVATEDDSVGSKSGRRRVEMERTVSWIMEGGKSHRTMGRFEEE